MMQTELIKKLGRAIVVTSFVLMTFSFSLLLFEGNQLASDEWLFGILILLFSVIYFPLSWLIVSRTPRNVIGWFFIVAITAFSLQMFGLSLTEILGIQSAILLLTGNLWLFGLLIPPSLMLLYFPTGTLISNRWRLVLFVDLFGMLILYMSFTLEALSAAMEIAWNEDAGRILLPLQIFMVIGLLGSLASVIVRYRFSRGVVRAQIKWLAYMAFVGILILLLSISTGLAENGFGVLYFFSPAILVALSIGLAILRYRLYDIDIIIRRTLSYSILTVVLALLYFGGIVLLQDAFVEVFGSDDSPIITVLSTLAIAALFNPLRTRIQGFIDRRFFRGRYDAEKTLTDFAAIVRDDVDMIRLSGSLLSVIERTMQPEQTSLWLKRQGD